MKQRFHQPMDWKLAACCLLMDSMLAGCHLPMGLMPAERRLPMGLMPVVSLAARSRD